MEFSKTRPAIIQDMFPQSQTADDAFIRDGMSPIELQRLGELIITREAQSRLRNRYGEWYQFGCDRRGSVENH